MHWGLVIMLAFCSNRRQARQAEAFSISFRPPRPSATLRVAPDFNQPEVGAEVVRLVREAFTEGGTDGLALAVATASIASPVGEESQRLLDSLTAAEWVDAVVLATGGSGSPDIGSRSSCLTAILSELGRRPGETRGVGGGVDQSLLADAEFIVLNLRSEDGADVPRSYNGAAARARKSLELLRLMCEPPCDCPPSVVAVSAAATAFFEAAAAAETDEEAAALEAAGHGVLCGDWRLVKESATRGGGGRRVRVKRGGRASPQVGNGGSGLLLEDVLPVLFEDEHVICVAKPAGRRLIHSAPFSGAADLLMPLTHGMCALIVHRHARQPRSGHAER